MDIFEPLKDGKSRIVKDKAFCQLLEGTLPSPSENLSSLFKSLDGRIKETDPSITTGALSNVHGDWYEWLVAISGWNHYSRKGDSSLPLLLPNVNQFDVANLYNSELLEFIQDLRLKVEKSSGVKLITSNPDLVIIEGDLARRILGKTSRIERLQTSVLFNLQELYREFQGKCDFESILGFISIKTSLRPDRRLQIAHEGSLMKALYIHLQTRQWIINPPGLKYYAMSTHVGKPDRDALKTVATHSITSVESLPQAAVDEVFEVNSLYDADQAFDQILHK